MNEIKNSVRQINKSLTLTKSGKQIISFLTLDQTNAQQIVVANLALMYSQASEKTVILDTDFNSNKIKDAFEIQNTVGLSDYLNDDHIKIESLINNVSNQDLAIIYSGNVDDSERYYLMSDARMNLLVKKLISIYDRIIINVPITSIEHLEDYMPVLSIADGAVLTIQRNRQQKKQVFKLIDFLEKSEVRILGYVNAK